MCMHFVGCDRINTEVAEALDSHLCRCRKHDAITPLQLCPKIITQQKF